MSARTTRLMAPLALVAIAAPLHAEDPPGTPDWAQASAVGPRKIRVIWHDPEAPMVMFEVEGRAPDPSSGYLRYTGFEGNHLNHWDAQVVPGGFQHCFRVWARTWNDTRSRLPTAWTCMGLPPERAAVGGRPMQPGEVAPIAGRTVWMPPEREDILLPESNGFVLAIPTGGHCPSPWFPLVWQNGGFPGLSPAGPLNAMARYGLCWSLRVPAGYHVSLPSPPPPPPAPVLKPTAPPPAPVLKPARPVDAPRARLFHNR